MAPFYFICLVPEDIGSRDLWFQVWAGGEGSEAALTFSCRETEQRSPLSEQLRRGMSLVSQPTEREAAAGGNQGCFHYTRA